MNGPCTLLAYFTATGRSPVLEYLADLERSNGDAYALWLYESDLIADLGTQVGAPHWKWLGDGLGEIRWRLGKTRYRVYCSEESEKRVVMLHPLEKKTETFENEDRKICLRRRADFRSADYNQKARRRLYEERHTKK